MTATSKRPVHLDLRKIRLPVGGVLSIMHRITGVVMILAIPVLVYVLTLSLDGPAGFAAAGALLSGGFGTLLLFAGLWAVFHHLLAGIRYLLIDVDLGVEKPTFRQTAWLVLVAAPLVAALATVTVS